MNRYNVKNKIGFTLIELLAVIVILAVIALIATPLIMNAITVAKKGSFTASANGLVTSVENTYATSMSDISNPTDIFYLYSVGVMTSYPSGKTINYKGTKPQEGGIVLHSDGTITMAIYDGTYCATKVRTDSIITTTTTTQANCLTGIYYKQVIAPFTNLMINGDFSDGTTGWGEIISLANKIATGGYRIYHGTGGSWGNDILYYHTRARTTSTGTPNIMVGTTSALITATTGAIQNQWYTISALHTINKVSQISQIALSLISAILEVDGNYGITVINLTQIYGVGNEPTVIQMDNNLNKAWIDSTTNTPKKYTAGGWITF